MVPHAKKTMVVQDATIHIAMLKVPYTKKHTIYLLFFLRCFLLVHSDSPRPTFCYMMELKLNLLTLT